jgi:hypothetical protein
MSSEDYWVDDILGDYWVDDILGGLLGG